MACKTQVGIHFITYIDLFLVWLSIFARSDIRFYTAALSAILRAKLT